MPFGVCASLTCDALPGSSVDNLLYQAESHLFRAVEPFRFGTVELVFPDAPFHNFAAVFRHESD